MAAADPAHRAWFHGALAPLSSPVFRKLWLASLGSNFGTLIQTVGAAWLMATLVHSSDMVAFVQAATALPIMLLSVPAGAIADIGDRRRVMLLAQGVMAVAALIMTLLAWQGALSPWSLLGFTFLLGCGSALYGPAWQASVGEQVQDSSQLPAAVALNALGFNIARTVGPALGGAIVAAAGAQAAFLVNTCSYVGLIAVLAAWRRAHPTPALPPESIGAAIGAGLRYARLSPAIRTVLVRSSLFGFLSSSLWSTVPLIARDRLGGGPLTYGVLLGAFGGGAVIAALASTGLRRQRGNDAVATGAALAFGLATVGVAASASMWLVVPAMVLAGGAWVLSFSTFNVVTQMSSPRWVVGRTLAFYQTGVFGGIAAGSWAFGLCAEHASLEAGLWIGGLALCGTGIVARRWPLHAAVSDIGPLAASAAGHPDVPVDPEAGPIVVSVEYRVAPEDEVAFVAAAHELGRTRRRDGARRWSLMQDLGDPGRFIERYQAVTWLDHLRQSARATAADAGVRERVLAFHRGEEAPRVRYLLSRAPGDHHDLHPALPGGTQGPGWGAPAARPAGVSGPGATPPPSKP
jgi:predicted MFS family arabinose efflux permease/quinol monooxygenase YgiN